eukprot:gene2801-3223_t
MQIKTFFLTGILCAFIFLAPAQNGNGGSITGKVVNERSEPVAGATVSLLPGQQVTTTDEQGVFRFTNLKPGNYTLRLRSMGRQQEPRKVVLLKDQVLVENFFLKEDARNMEEVSVLGFSKNKEINRQAYNVLSIDVKPLHNSTIDLGQVLNRVSGARVQESGGVGSDMKFSLNGFTGRQVRFFLDGIPMDNFGSSFQLNTIPVNFASRIEVYKGVVPVWLGGDALGGAVNIVSNTNPNTYVDASYSIGSFNTHKSTLNAGYTSKSGLTVQLNAFQNYSDNNYWVDVEVVDHQTGLHNPERRRRFHDQYHNETLVANMGVVGKKYADQLLFGLTVGANRADIQTGNRMYDVYGARWRSGKILQPSIKYSKKDLFVKGLDLRFNANFNFGEERTIDTAFKFYSWDGRFVYRDPANPGRLGGESRLQDYRFKNNNGIVNTAVYYTLSDRQSISLNHIFTSFNRKGQNSFDPESILDRQPRKTYKNITGLGYRLDLNSKLSSTAFVKYYNQKSISSLVEEKYDREKDRVDYTVSRQQGNFSKTGYGAALTYFLWPELQLKASYEKAYRLPSNEELFGDEINLLGNSELRPENSNNINLGLTYGFDIGKTHFFELQGNFIFRNADDYIRAIVVPGGRNGEYIQRNINESKVSNRGIDAELHYHYKRLFSLNANLTYQNLRNDTRFESLKGGGRSTVESPVYRDRIPNIPYLFGNANASLSFDDVLQKGNRLSVGYNLLFVNRFFLFWPSQGNQNSKLSIPTQVAHDASLIYAMAGGKYNVGLECFNLTDAKLFDNYGLQKSSRAFNLKLRYYFSKAH